MKQTFTRAQILDALSTHKTVQKAAKALRISYPEMQKYLRRYGIVCNHKAKETELKAKLYTNLYSSKAKKIEPEDKKGIIDKLLAGAERAVEIAEEQLSDPNLIPRLMVKMFKPYKFKKGE